MKNLFIVILGVFILAGCSNPFGITDEEWNSLSSEQRALYRKEFHYYKADKPMPQERELSESLFQPSPVQLFNQPMAYLPQPQYHPSMMGEREVQ